MHASKTDIAQPGFSLGAPLGSDYLAEPEDILTAKQALGRLGYYRTADGAEPGPWVDGDLFAGIRAFQRDNGLRVDGLMRPGGETEMALNAALNQQALPANDDQPPANDGQKEALMDCEQQKFLDDMKCKTLLNPVARSQCFSSAQLRYSNCLRHGYPYPDLFTG